MQKMTESISVAGMPLSPKYQVNVVIVKLTLSWKYYTYKLMHKKVDISIKVLKNHLKIKELQHEKGKKVDHYVKVHVLENKSDDKKPLKNKWFKLNSKEGKKPFKKDS